MKFLLISDNVDTIVGMRFAGILGIIAKTKEEVKEILINAKKQKNIGLVLVTENLVMTCEEWINNFRLTVSHPLVIQIPDRHNASKFSNILTNYIKKSVGIKID